MKPTYYAHTTKGDALICICPSTRLLLGNLVIFEVKQPLT